MSRWRNPVIVRAKDVRASPNVVALRPNMLTDGNWTLKAHLVGAELAILLHDDSVGTGRQRRASEDARRLTLGARHTGASGRNPLRDIQRHGGSACVLTTNGNTVHRTIVKTGNVD